VPPDPTSPATTRADQRVCPVCQAPFTPAPRQPHQRYCTTSCRQAAWRRRQRSGPATPPANRSQLEPPQVAIQGCPHCGRPIAVVALLVTPQAARPHPTSQEVIAIQPR
jgi:hypothetical protein